MPEFGNPLGGGFQVTSQYGTRGGVAHQGIDLVPAGSNALGSPVVASAGGTVKLVPNSSTAGNMVVIDHGGGYTSRYMHLQDFTVQDGQTVAPGQQIGRIGYSGQVRPPGPGGAHLHYEILKDGQPVDPLPTLYGQQNYPTPAESRVTSPTGTTGSPGPTKNQDGNIDTPQKQDVKPKVSKRLQDDISDTDIAWDKPRDIHEPYYASAEVIIGGKVICPLTVQRPNFADDEEIPGIDLRLLEFQYRTSVEGGSIALCRIFVKSWSDVVETMAICSMNTEVQFRYGYTNIEGGLNGPIYGYVLNCSLEFVQNGYNMSIEILDKPNTQNSEKGARHVTWRALSGRVSDIAQEIAEQNGWLPCIEPTIPMDAEKNQYVQRMQTDINFISEVLAPAARSDVPRPWIAGDGKGYGPYYTALKWDEKLGKNVLHFHPLHNATSNPTMKSVRTYVWGGVTDSAKHQIGTVINFMPEFLPRAFQLLGGAFFEGTSLDIYKKAVRQAAAKGSDVQDLVLPNGAGALQSKLSAPQRTRRVSYHHRDPDLLLTAVAQRHFILRDSSFSAQLIVLGDPFMRSFVYVTVKVVRPEAGVLMFYDWLVTETTHTIVNGEFTTSYSLLRAPTQPGVIRPDDIKEPGYGAGLVQQQSSLAIETKPLKVGKTWYDKGDE